MKLDSILDFGRYRGRSIEAIWTGINPFNEAEVIKKYLYQLCSFLLNINYIDEIPCSKFDIDLNSKEIVLFNDYYLPITIHIENNFIEIKTMNENIYLALFNILSVILKKSFQIIPQYYSKPLYDKHIGHSINSINFQLLQADPSYIIWAIENHESFFFNPNDLESLISKKCKYFNHFELEKTLNNIFNYKAFFEYQKFTLPRSTIEINKIKYLKKAFDSDEFFDISPEYNLPKEPNQLCAACHQTSCICHKNDREILINFL